MRFASGRAAVRFELVARHVLDMYLWGMSGELTVIFAGTIVKRSAWRERAYETLSTSLRCGAKRRGALPRPRYCVDRPITCRRVARAVRRRDSPHCARS